MIRTFGQARVPRAPFEVDYFDLCSLKKWLVPDRLVDFNFKVKLLLVQVFAEIEALAKFLSLGSSNGSVPEINTSNKFTQNSLAVFKHL
ncbi:hypothetical protein HYALB_00012970 [Hymenoscyphus albidus]|uniref:Uncharacterized protein n=1 Tax=Hymenoscyphus albidus TaxID=595503 RepID=A0A9N9LUU8_9HELO|nr:hypothetical protein HYALB_00012970 [Hymenoscyphus albidus]